jgi:hypothetical protein
VNIWTQKGKEVGISVYIFFSFFEDFEEGGEALNESRDAGVIQGERHLDNR